MILYYFIFCSTGNYLFKQYKNGIALQFISVVLFKLLSLNM